MPLCIGLPLPPMKRLYPKENPNRFSGKVRHYHRSSQSEDDSWNEWVYGPGAKKRHPLKWLKFLGIAIAILALAGIVAGLIIELR